MERGRKSRAGRGQEMPLRVQDTNRTSTVYTTPMSKQPSFGKLSMTRPSSVTSEKRTSFFGPRTSGASMPRSSVSGFGGAEKIKDSRPLHDKAFVQQCIRQLHEFLTEQGYLVAAKILQSPSTKEFVKMFEFIYRLLDPTFEMPSVKVEEVVPAMFKSLRYPFVLSKCSMYSVGAPHTWPQALGALMWLVDTVKINQSLAKQDICEDSEDIEDGAEYNKSFCDHVTETYYKFIHGKDEFKEEDEAFSAKLKQVYNVDEALQDSLEERHDFLSKKVESLEKETQKDRLMTMRMDKAKGEEDLQKLQSYRSNLVSFKANLENKYSELTEEVETAVSHLETLKHEKNELQQLLQNQKYTPADVERINREKRELQQTITSLSKALEDAEINRWNEEINVAKVKETMDLKVTEYNKLARKLKLIPLSAENACGHDFEIRSFGCGSDNEVQHKLQIQILLKKMISDVEEAHSRLVNLKFRLVQSGEQISSNIVDKSNDLKQIREQIRKFDEQLDANMQELAREEQEWEAEIESMENHYKLLEKKINYGYDDAVQQLKATQQQYHLVLQETSEERRIVANNLASVFTTFADHLSLTEKCLEDMHSRVHRLCSKTIEDGEADVQKLMEIFRKFQSKANSL